MAIIENGGRLRLDGDKATPAERLEFMSASQDRAKEIVRIVDARDAAARRARN